MKTISITKKMPQTKAVQKGEVTKKAVIVGSSDAYFNDPNMPGEGYCNPAPPLAIVALGSYLEANDVPVELIDIEMDFGVGIAPDARRAVHKRVGKYLRDHAEEIGWVGISLHSNLNHGLNQGVELIADIHAEAPDLPIVIGGYFATSNYKELLEKYPFVKAAVLGNGEYASLDISRRLARGESFPSDEIPNLAWREEGKIKTTPTMPMPLEGLPVYDFSLFRNIACYEKIDIQSTRGCAYSCEYCLEETMRPYGKYSMDWLTKQFEVLEAVTPNNRFHMYDPLFGVGNQRLKEIVNVITSRPRKYEWAAMTRAGVVSPEMMPALSASGLESVTFGIETASVSTLLRMKKCKTEGQAKRYVQDSLDILTACFENNVSPVITMMIGYPGDTLEDCQISLDFLEELKRRHEQARYKPGFFVAPFITKIYENSNLLESVKGEFPDAILQAGSLAGETIATSEEITLETLQDYLTKFLMMSCGTETCISRIRNYWVRQPEAVNPFLAAHPEVLDEEGVFQPSRMVGMEGFWGGGHLPPSQCPVLHRRVFATTKQSATAHA